MSVQALGAQKSFFRGRQEDKTKCTNLKISQNVEANKSLRKRSIKRKYMNTSKNLRIIGVNSAGINSKTESFNDVLKRLEPHVWCLQETKLKPKNTIKCDEVKKFQTYYLSRKKYKFSYVLSSFFL